MMVNTISGGDMAFNAMLYTPPEGRVLEYLNNSINNASRYFNDGYNSFITKAQDIYNSFNGESALQAGRAILSQMSTHFNPNAIMYIPEERMGEASPYMMQYIMAQPDMWLLNKSQRCDGFDGVYYNSEPELVDHQQGVMYNRVMNGVVRWDEEVPYFTTYSDGEDGLDTWDKFAILDTWNTVANMIANGKDPSSIYGDEL